MVYYRSCRLYEGQWLNDNRNGRGVNVIPTAISTRANSKITNHTAKVSTFGSMGRSMKASGSMDSKRAKESGKASLVTPISASGSSPKRMGTVYTSGRTEIDMRASGNSV